MALGEKKTVQDYLNTVDYSADSDYVPSDFALKFINFIKLVNGSEGETNTSPVIHYQMLDLLASKEQRIANLCSRGIGKTTLFAEYLILYVAVFEKIDNFGDVTGMIYLSDSIDNGVKSLRKNIEERYNRSEFLQTYLAQAKFTDVYMEFTNKAGHRLGVKSFGSLSGIRGTKIFGHRPTLAIMDDLVSDKDAVSPTVMTSIKHTVYRGVFPALDPNKRKIIFSGTPFSQSDILYEAVESGAWNVNVYPICEKFPCTREEFKGAWEDRFSYDFVKDQYEALKALGQLASFNQEYQLSIMSEEDRLVSDSDIMWYKRSSVISNKGKFNFYITTDFATSEKTSADYSVISVWAYNNNGDWYWVDGVCKRQLMDKNINDLFRLAQMYNPQQVGIEVSGQQGGFIPWIQDQMMNRNIYFTLASDRNSSLPGIRPTTNKLVRFNTMVPLFKAHKMFFPEEMKEDFIITELMEELRLVSMKGMKSKHDDILDTISMLALLSTWKPSEEATPTYNSERDMWELDVEDSNDYLDSYVV